MRARRASTMRGADGVRRFEEPRVDSLASWPRSAPSRRLPSDDRLAPALHRPAAGGPPGAAARPPRAPPPPAPREPPSVDDLLRYAAEEAARLLSADGAILYLLDPETGRLRFTHD